MVIAGLSLILNFLFSFKTGFYFVFEFRDLMTRFMFLLTNIFFFLTMEYRANIKNKSRFVAIGGRGRG